MKKDTRETESTSASVVYKTTYLPKDLDAGAESTKALPHTSTAREAQGDKSSYIKRIRNVSSSKGEQSAPNGISTPKKTQHKRAFSLTRGFASKAKPQEDVFPLKSHPPMMEKCLVSQRSVDNIVLNSPSASPISIRSAPGGKVETVKKRTRPASLVVLGNHSRTEIKEQKPDRAPSMDSLARNSLLAAQLLHLIPANKARERNFLHGRIAANSLLGTIELEKVLPVREVGIYVATWNMNSQAPPQGLNPLLLPDGLDNIPEIVAVGTQESYPDRFQWEVTLQETLGPSHVLLHSAAFGTLHLAIYLRRDLIWFVSVCEEANYSLRPGTAFRTKGALGVAFYLFGTSLLFITCHLTAHQDKVKERLQDIRRIVKSLELPKVLPIRYRGKSDVTDNFDYVFICGDLNFRLSKPRAEVIKWVENQSFPLPEPLQPRHDDQLSVSLHSGNILRGFKEGPITFPPTYKYDPGTQNFDTSQKQRTPSYTDRILFKSSRPSSEGGIECLAYRSVPSVCSSDHKPVWALYKCPVRPGIDTIPLAAGLFNRDVYLEAIKRRAAAMDQRDDDTSTVCSIQ